MIGPKCFSQRRICFVRHCNSALREQILDVTKAKREPDVESDRLANDFRANIGQTGYTEIG
jgi:hypothetical protein